MSAVTLNPKRYTVFVCAGCNLLSIAERNDKTTCGGTCRVRAHRNGALNTLREVAETLQIKPSSILQADAIKRLRPDLGQQLLRGTLTIEAAQPDACNAFFEVLRKAVA